MKVSKLLTQIIAMNVVIFLCVLVAPITQVPSIVGGLSIIIFLTLTALVKPRNALLLFIGIKLTFDAFWFLELPFPGLERIGLLGLIVFPFLVSLLGLKLIKQRSYILIIVASIYLLWTLFATILNGNLLNFELVIRQSGMLLGLLIGVVYLKKPEDFDLFLYLIFISTIIPVIASIIQLLFNNLGIAIFYYKFDPTLFYRPAGLYYDPGTIGMVSILSLICNLYLLFSNSVRRKYIKFHYIMLFFSTLTIIVGATRSVLVAMSLIILIIFVRYLKKVPMFIYVLSATFIFLTKPYIDSAMLKSSKDIKVVTHLSTLLQNPEYRTMFTGRVGIWQDIWQKFKDADSLQKLFGTGQSSNAHSSYFFLLLQIGVLGLLFYILIHMKILIEVLSSQINKEQRVVAIVALVSILVIGFSLTAVTYTSFQWFIYTIVGAVYPKNNKIIYRQWPAPI